MSTLIVGDVHGCAAELQELLLAAPADRTVLVGDLFTKGPDPAGVWRIVRERRLESVLGNHDQRLLDQLDGNRDDPAAADCLARLDAIDPDYRPWLRSLPLFLDVAGLTVVHAALHPTGDLDRTERRVALNLRRWPDDRPTDPRWWAIYEGQRPVAFGHDARRGLVRVERDGRPWLMGLDTGCVYGGALTGWLVEEDRLVQVPARAAYKPV